MNLPTHKQVVAFLEVCRDFHFSHAAKRLGVAQPQLSRSIRELEAVVGERLFAREGRRVGLTSSGEVFLKEVYRLPAILSRAVQGARRAAAGEESILRLGFLGALMGEDLLGVFDRFRREHPNTQLSLVDLPPAELARQVELGELDGAFLGVRPSSLPAGLAYFEWKHEPLLACLPKGHALEGRKRLQVRDLKGETLVVLTTRLAPFYREFLDDLFSAAGERIEEVRETNGSDAMLSMVVAGCGVALLPRSALRGAAERLSAVPLQGKGTRLREVFLYRPEAREDVGGLLKLLAGRSIV